MPRIVEIVRPVPGDQRSIPTVCCILLSILVCEKESLGWQGGNTKSIVWALDRLDTIDGNPPEILGRPTLIDSPQGKAISFDGSKDGLLMPINPLDGLPQFTVEVIFQPAAGGPKEQRFLHFQE